MVQASVATKEIAGAWLDGYLLEGWRAAVGDDDVADVL